MSRTNRRGGFLGMPGWLSDTMTAIGLSAVVYVFVKYTFVGEVLERAYVRAFGRSVIDEIGDDLRMTGNEIAADLHQASRELERP